MNPILTEDYRGGVLESFHRGVVCLVDRDEKILYSLGDVHQICYPRSALKPFQQIDLITSGAADFFRFTAKELAVMCGSHNGEEVHVQVVESILSKIGLDSSYLKCGSQYPSDRSSANSLIKKEQKPKAIHNNCSGKHAGFLALSVFWKCDHSSYLDANHPVQKAIRKTVAEFHSVSENSLAPALDGCSAPIYPLTVFQQALGYMRLSNPHFGDNKTADACRRLIHAMRGYPHMVAGRNRYCTELIQVCERELLGKTGAEGVFGISFHQHRIGACIKIDDGKMHPQYQVAQKLIQSSGLFQESELAGLSHYAEGLIKNFNQFETGLSKVSDSILTKEAIQALFRR